jgi:ABC-type bacteriocin/lantibiotic exporter with double-glycine peptidase domain
MKLLIEQVKQSLSYLDKRDRIRLLIAIFGQIVLALLDMAGAAGLGVIGVIAAVSIANSSSPDSIVRVEEFLGIANYPATKQITILGVVVVLLFVFKTIGSLYLNRKVLQFLAAKQVRIAGEIWKKVLNGDYLSIARYSRQELAQAVTDSLNISIIGILGNFMLVISELILLTFLFVLLSVVYPSMAILTLLTFGTLAYVTQNVIGKKTREMNAEYSRAAVASKTILMDSLSVLPEIKVSGRASYFINKFSSDRAIAADAYVKSLWLGQVPKYVLEIGLVLSGIVVFFFTQATSTSVEAIGRIVVFLAASGRLVPSILRLQALVIGMHANTGTSQSINTLLDKLLTMSNSSISEILQDTKPLPKISVNEPTEIQFEGVSFRYTEQGQVFEFGDLFIPRGRAIGIIGKSGVGKTTLVQLILGLIEPSTGLVTLDGKSPTTQSALNVGSVSYLPQNVAIVSGDIAENVALGVTPEHIDEAKLRLALQIAALDDWVETLPLGSKTVIDEQGLNFSGGQLQRIGIARAVYNRPGLIVLDEPTSSLDEETENAFLKMLAHLRGQTTFIMITHKIAMLDHVDDVLFLEVNTNKVSARLMDPKSTPLIEQKSLYEE